MPSTEALVDGRRTDTRERIIQTATRLFGYKGYTATSIAEIEGAVGLRAGSGGLYRHFPSKEDVLLAAITGYSKRVAALRQRLAEERVRGEAPSDIECALRRLLGALADFLSGEPAIVHLTTDATSLPDNVREAIGDAWNDGYGMIADIFVANGVTEGKARFLAVAALGSLNHYVTHTGFWLQEPNGVALEEFIDEWVKVWKDAAGRNRLRAVIR